MEQNASVVKHPTMAEENVSQIFSNNINNCKKWKNSTSKSIDQFFTHTEDHEPRDDQPKKH